MYQRLLVPLDGSRLAEAVLPTVEQLAEVCGSTVILLHIIERTPHATIHGERHLTSPDEATAYLGEVAGRLANRGLTVVLHTHDAPEGDVARSIAVHAEEEHSDLIVLCAHGRGGIRGLLFGSIALQVLRRGLAPVLLVRPAHDGSALPFAPRAMLVPLDATTAAEAALQPARALAKAFGAALHLLMVVPTQATIRGERSATTTLLPIASQAALELECQEAYRYLDGLLVRIQEPGLQVSTSVARGDVAPVLAAAATEPGIGLVIVATHGRSGLQTMWARSATVNLLAQPGTPVLLLRRGTESQDSSN
jgi:nucleotide-binding universal stress UspA family protein